MFHRFNLIRALAVPACLIWAATEMLALQRARFARRRAQPIARTVKNI